MPEASLLGVAWGKKPKQLLLRCSRWEGAGEENRNGRALNFIGVVGNSWGNWKQRTWKDEWNKSVKERNASSF